MMNVSLWLYLSIVLKKSGNILSYDDRRKGGILAYNYKKKRKL